jgi:hypothetical protein
MIRTRPRNPKDRQAHRAAGRTADPNPLRSISPRRYPSAVIPQPKHVLLGTRNILERIAAPLGRRAYCGDRAGWGLALSEIGIRRQTRSPCRSCPRWWCSSVEQGCARACHRVHQLLDQEVDKLEKGELHIAAAHPPQTHHLLKS